jgi:hypothetical protein
MPMSGETAMRQAHLTACEYAAYTLKGLCQELGINIGAHGWRDRLAPFAPVWAAMIRAAAQDYDTAARSGFIDGPRL